MTGTKRSDALSARVCPTRSDALSEKAKRCAVGWQLACQITGVWLRVHTLSTFETPLLEQTLRPAPWLPMLLPSHSSQMARARFPAVIVKEDSTIRLSRTRLSSAQQ